NYCVGKYFKDPLIGCSWRPEGRPRTVIVTTESVGALPGIHPVLWAHEFGHTTGLLHRKDQNDVALMTPCGLEAFNDQINKDECRHFLVGPVTHYPPGLGPGCPSNTSVRRQHRTD